MQWKLCLQTPLRGVFCCLFSIPTFETNCKFLTPKIIMLFSQFDPFVLWSVMNIAAYRDFSPGLDWMPCRCISRESLLWCNSEITAVNTLLMRVAIVRDWIDKWRVNDGERRRRRRKGEKFQTSLHLCPVLSVISSLLRKAFASTWPELSLSLSVCHTNTVVVSSFIIIHKAHTPPICLCMWLCNVSMKRIHVWGQSVIGVFGPLSTCFCVI